ALAGEQVEPPCDTDLDAMDGAHVAGEPALERKTLGIRIRAAVAQLLQPTQRRGDVGGQARGVTPASGRTGDRSRSLDGTTQERPGSAELRDLLMHEHGRCSMSAPCRAPVTTG